jgi:hypothetical protein
MRSKTNEIIAETRGGRVAILKGKYMPVSIKKTDGKYRVSTPNQVHAKHTTRKKAERQANLLRAIDHGWHPTGKAAREAIRIEAQTLASSLLEVDEIGSVPIPASGKSYARIHGMRGLRDKQRLYISMARDLGDRGKSTKGFPNYDGSAFTGPKHSEGLERHRTEPTHLHGGRYGKQVASKGKTGGKFSMPGNWSVGHAIKH